MAPNYFEFFDLPVSFLLDEQQLKQRFLRNSKRYHPDFYTLATADEQEYALQMATLNNEAYRTLASQDQRIMYVLQLKNIINDNERYQLPSDFLMEMIDLNEAIDDLLPDSTAQQYQHIQQELQKYIDQLQDDTQKLLVAYNQTPDTATILEKIKKNHYKMKYLLRIQEKLLTFAPQ
jgi:molecular chaperone HscB